jgi:hypothetical protein
LWGSLFRVHGWSLFAPHILEIVDETTNDGTGSSRLLIDIFEFVRQYRVFNAVLVLNPEPLNL